MNYIDLILLIFLLWSVYRGFKNGLIIEVASLAALILGIFGAIKFSHMTSEFLVRKFEMTTQYLPLISFAITFVVIVIAIHLLAKVLDKLVKAIALGFINRLLGVLFGIIKTAFILSIVLVILNTIDRKIHFLPEEKIEESLLYRPISAFAPLLFRDLNFENIRDFREPPEKPDEVLI